MHNTLESTKKFVKKHKTAVLAVGGAGLAVLALTQFRKNDAFNDYIIRKNEEMEAKLFNK